MRLAKSALGVCIKDIGVVLQHIACPHPGDKFFPRGANFLPGFHPHSANLSLRLFPRFWPDAMLGCNSEKAWRSATEAHPNEIQTYQFQQHYLHALHRPAHEMPRACQARELSAHPALLAGSFWGNIVVKTETAECQLLKSWQTFPQASCASHYTPTCRGECSVSIKADPDQGMWEHLSFLFMGLLTRGFHLITPWQPQVDPGRPVAWQSL